MVTLASTFGSGFCFSKLGVEGLKPTTHSAARPRRMVAVRAEAQAINPEIRKNEEKVVDSVVVAELSKPLTAYCSFTFDSAMQQTQECCSFCIN
ncbi:CDGSH iron-sulfur domain-containing protein NEET-like isoform X2 [Hevea brasiliensis]|uniref:CDGSH iron-sulfur domain-containing protein NEET-like isoform X2 n=1 Tax=Hevea brasiliensis TaxID=3981 RepID=UPI0025D51A90|nr:CDGSH iron-sulfur domain-containing protein NEET-like isoform X2 [Hevea brasiliensis]